MRKAIVFVGIATLLAIAVGILALTTGPEGGLIAKISWVVSAFGLVVFAVLMSVPADTTPTFLTVTKPELRAWMIRQLLPYTPGKPASFFTDDLKMDLRAIVLLNVRMASEFGCPMEGEVPRTFGELVDAYYRQIGNLRHMVKNPYP